VGYLADTPVTALTLSIAAGIGMLNDVGTHPDHQRKGYASALIAHALNYAQGQGAHICYLEASSSGVTVYEKLGFEKLFRADIWEKG
jgi:GNAT superfamily N-acetyltransferase